MRDMLCRAIESRSVITFSYKGVQRVVEPHLLGFDSDGDLTLSAWQVSGSAPAVWRDFHVSRMGPVNLTGQTFTTPRPGFNRGDETIDRVVCRL